MSQFDRFAPSSFPALNAQPAFAAPQQNLGDALASRPLDVFGGALLGGTQQLGLRPDGNQLMSQVVVGLLNTILSLVTSLLKNQLGQGATAGQGQGFPGIQQQGGLPAFPQGGFQGQPAIGQGLPFDPGAPVLGQGQPVVQQGEIPVGFAPTGTLPIPTDKGEFASYIASATDAAGNQNGNIDQSRAVPGTRYGTVKDGESFDAAVARSYAYQFAAKAKGYDGRTADGLADGANAFYRMSPAAQTFMQVAAVYKGDLEGGAKNYNNAKLKELLKDKGYDGADREGVGATDIETLGAVADALDRGVITLQDVLGKDGAIADNDKYKKAIDLVQSGKFADMLTKYDSTPVEGAQATGNGTAGAGSATAGSNGATAGTNQAAAGTARGTAGDAKGTAGDAKGTAGDAKGTAGDAKGTAGDAKGTAGDAKGTAGDAKGTAGNGKATAGDAGGAQAAAGGPTLGGVEGFYRDALAARGLGVGGISQGVSYQSLSNEQRTQMSGMDDRHRAILHLWGIQMGSAGQQDGGVLINVLQNPEKFKPAEVQVAKELAAQDRANYGGLTGKSLDQAFFGVYRDLTGQDISQRYGNAPIRYARGPVDTNNRVTGQNGLNNFENEVLQLWGHSPLFTGQVDGSILDYSLNSSNRLEVNLNKSDLEALKQADLGSDGVLNGDSLNKSMLDVLDHVYLGGPQASVGRSMNEALEEASQRRLGLLPPPAQPAAARSINPIGLGQAAKGSNCPFLNGGGIQVQQPQQGSSYSGSSSSSSSSSSGGYTPPPAVSYTAPSTPPPASPVKPSPATISY